MNVSSAQPRLYVTKWNAVIEARERYRHHRRRVPLRQHHFGFFCFQYPVEIQQQSASQFSQCLIGSHDIEVDIRRDTKEAHDLIEQVPVLRRRKDANIRSAICFQRQYDRGHLDGLGAGAKNGQYFEARHGVESK